MSYKSDFHIHSYYSDGSMSPVELVTYYHEKEYDMISITDHDGVAGVHDAKIAGEAVKMAVISGVELSTELDGLDLHLLGYYFDEKNPQLLAKCEELKTSRRERNRRLVEKLNQMGYEMTLEELEKQSGTGYVGKPNIARLMVERGYIDSVGEAFEPGGVFESPEVKAIRRRKMDTIEAIDLLREASGMAVLAHPGKIKGLGEKESDEYWSNLEALVKKLKTAGLKGIECYHPSHSDEDAIKFVVLAGKYHLHITEGSDFHGK